MTVSQLFEATSKFFLSPGQTSLGFFNCYSVKISKAFIFSIFNDPSQFFFSQNASSKNESSVAHEVCMQSMVLSALLRGKSLSCSSDLRSPWDGLGTLRLRPLLGFILTCSLCSEDHGLLLFHRFVSPFLPKNFCCSASQNPLFPDVCLALFSPLSAFNPVTPTQWDLWPSYLPGLPFPFPVLFLSFMFSTTWHCKHFTYLPAFFLHSRS